MVRNGSKYTDHPAPANTVLDLRFRSSQALHLSAFWPQNYMRPEPRGACSTKTWWWPRSASAACVECVGGGTSLLEPNFILWFIPALLSRGVPQQ